MKNTEKQTKKSENWLITCSDKQKNRKMGVLRQTDWKKEAFSINDYNKRREKGNGYLQRREFLFGQRMAERSC